ncbi:hypothetical protein FOZG_10354 [Fusarium oxysporum Fo47]|uniref:Uncharacterized protein n=1 Tax=Fusarium oxysporum Fo47 TaxID=660027 RepID=W9K4I6_FUSOX|nr:hypothetical protein FOZG_10354 [Fusarium oxysporum Fo47]
MAGKKVPNAKESWGFSTTSHTKANATQNTIVLTNRGQLVDSYRTSAYPNLGTLGPHYGLCDLSLSNKAKKNKEFSFPNVNEPTTSYKGTMSTARGYRPTRLQSIPGTSFDGRCKPTSAIYRGDRRRGSHVECPQARRQQMVQSTTNYKKIRLGSVPTSVDGRTGGQAEGTLLTSHGSQRRRCGGE